MSSASCEGDTGSLSSETVIDSQGVHRPGVLAALRLHLARKCWLSGKRSFLGGQLAGSFWHTGIKGTWCPISLTSVALGQLIRQSTAVSLRPAVHEVTSDCRPALSASDTPLPASITCGCKINTRVAKFHQPVQRYLVGSVNTPLNILSNKTRFGVSQFIDACNPPPDPLTRGLASESFQDLEAGIKSC